MEAMIFAEELLLCLRKRGGKRKNPGIGATNLGRGNDKAQFDRFSRCSFEAISLRLAVPIWHYIRNSRTSVPSLNAGFSFMYTLHTLKEAGDCIGTKFSN